MWIILIKITKKQKKQRHGGGELRLYSGEAEKNVLGAIMLDNEIIEDCNLTVEDFYLPIHKNIYEAMLTLKQNKRPIEPIGLADKLKDISRGIDFKYISSLVVVVDISENYEYHAKIIKERSAQRQLVKIADTIKQTANKDLSNAIEEAIKNIQSLEIAEEEMSGYVPDLIDGVIEEIKTNNKKGDITGITTGFDNLNKLTGGWQGSRYYILGARPKMGKTSLFCQVADIAAKKVPTIIFSLEMSKNDIIKLLIYQNSKIDGMLEQTGQLTAKEFTEIREMVKELYSSPLFIDDSSRTINAIRRSIKNIQKVFSRKGKGKVGLIVVDYLQMLHGDKKLQRNYQLEEISRGLKEIAKDFNVCVLALSQLSREVETRRDKKPIPSDLRDSGSFEQDCDGLMLMYRDSYYNGQNQNNTIKYSLKNKEYLADIVDINFFLNRHGATGIVKLDFIAPFRRFFNHKENELISLASGYQGKKDWYEAEKPDDCPF